MFRLAASAPFEAGADAVITTLMPVALTILISPTGSRPPGASGRVDNRSTAPLLEQVNFVDCVADLPESSDSQASQAVVAAVCDCLVRKLDEVDFSGAGFGGRSPVKRWIGQQVFDGQCEPSFIGRNETRNRLNRSLEQRQ